MFFLLLDYKMENGDQFQESKAKYDCLLFGNSNPSPFTNSYFFWVIFIICCLIFADLDDTLYPLSSGLSGHVTKNIQGNDFHYVEVITLMYLNFMEFIYFYWMHCTLHIAEYMLQKLGIQEDQVPELCVSLYKTYGTTMAGLKV